MILMVAYDLHADRDYGPVVKALESVAHLHLQGSVWIIDTTENCATWRKRLQALIDDDDEIFVAELHKHWSSVQIGDVATTWLKNDKRSWR